MGNDFFFQRLSLISAGRLAEKFGHRCAVGNDVVKIGQKIDLLFGFVQLDAEKGSLFQIKGPHKACFDFFHFRSGNLPHRNDNFPIREGNHAVLAVLLAGAHKQRRIVADDRLQRPLQPGNVRIPRGGKAKWDVVHDAFRALHTLQKHPKLAVGEGIKVPRAVAARVRVGLLPVEKGRDSRRRPSLEDLGGGEEKVLAEFLQAHGLDGIPANGKEIILAPDAVYCQNCLKAPADGRFLFALRGLVFGFKG